MQLSAAIKSTLRMGLINDHANDHTCCLLQGRLLNL